MNGVTNNVVHGIFFRVEGMEEHSLDFEPPLRYFIPLGNEGRYRPVSTIECPSAPRT